MALVYRAVSPSGKQYIGITTQSFRARQARHMRETWRNTPFSAAVRKYGARLVWTVVADDLTEQEAQALEVRLIREGGTQAPHGYNLRDGGTGGAVHAQTRAKMASIREQQLRTDEGQARMRALIAAGHGPRVHEKTAKTLKERAQTPEGRAELATLRSRITDASYAKCSETRRGFTREQVVCLRFLLAMGAHGQDVAAWMNVSESTVSRVRNGGSRAYSLTLVA